MVDLTKTFETRNGVLISDAGTDAHLIAAGVDAPSGAAPVGSRYERTNGEVWEKFIADWGIVTTPVESQAVTYTGINVDFITFYKNATQTTPNRIAEVTVGYTVDNPTSETWRYYDPADGTTLLQTSTLTHTFSGIDYQSTARVDT